MELNSQEYGTFFMGWKYSRAFLSDFAVQWAG